MKKILAVELRPELLFFPAGSESREIPRGKVIKFELKHGTSKLFDGALLALTIQTGGSFLFFGNTEY